MTMLMRDAMWEDLEPYLPALEEGRWSPSSVAIVLAQIFEQHDLELGHYLADLLMCVVLERLGYGDAVSVFWAKEKWYS